MPFEGFEFLIIAFPLLTQFIEQTLSIVEAFTNPKLKTRNSIQMLHQ